MGFLPLLIFVITVVIDKSNRKKRRNRTGHFPPLPDMDSSQETAKLMTLQARSKARRKVRIKLYIKKMFPHPAGK